MADFEEVTIPVPWGHISGKWWGSKSKQPIVALHGRQDNAGTFDNLAPFLVKKGFAVLALDLPGHGRSSHYPTGLYYYVHWEGVHCLRRVAKHFNWDKVSLMGHSLGGAISFLYAAIYSEQVEKYIAIDAASPASQDPRKMIETLGSNLDKFLSYDDYHDSDNRQYPYDTVVDLLQNAYNGSISKEGCEILMKRGCSPVGEDSLFTFSRDQRLKVSTLGMMTIEHALLYASKITCHVLNIKADPGLSFRIPEYYTMVLDKISSSAKSLECHTVKGTHHLHLNDPESVSDIIINFLLK